MVDPNDVQAMKFARSELLRRGFDISRASIHSHFGVMHVTGVIPNPAFMSAETYKHEMEVIKQVMRTRAHVKDVVFEAQPR
jgi:hypothetical protein